MQMDQPLPEVNVPEGTEAAGMEASQVRAKQQTATEPPKAFKVVSLVLGSPDFQRQ